MVIRYKFVRGGEIFECESMEDLTQLDNYHIIVYINCSLNKLTVLPTLPNSLRIVYCFDNTLILLPTLPTNLISLYCYRNQLTLLPTLPISLMSLSCFDNLLSFLPKFQDSLEFKNYDNIYGKNNWKRYILYETSNS